MSTAQIGHVLDNPCWFALNSHHAKFASGTDLVKSYPADVFPATALVDHSEAAFADFERVLKASETTSICEANPPQIPGWTIDHTVSLDQLVCQQRVPRPEHGVEVIELGFSNMPEIHQLLDVTRPGPIFPRTLEMGHYIGIRQKGQLVAMAGERFQMTGYCEICTICTHPDWQGRGYARLLTSIQSNRIWDRGEIPFLDVAPHNTVAYHLYESMSFRKRRTMVVNIMSRA